MHAVDFLKKPPAAIPMVVVVFGPQRHFKQQAILRLRSLVIGDDEASLTRFDGDETDLQSVADELRTVSMWGDRRLVLVEEADGFVSRHRAALEKLVEHPPKKSVLVLDVGAWPKNTRIARLLAQSGLEIDCSELKGAALSKWLQDLATETYAVKLDREASALLLELVGEQPGLLDQELSKLVSYVGDRRRIGLDDVRGLVGGWRIETTWAMTDAIRDGRLGDALAALDQLLTAGEPPLKLLGGVNFVFRKLAYATELARNQPLDQALRDAGVFPRDIAPTTAYLRRLGRAKAERLLTALIVADAGLKGASRTSERIQFELLLFRLSGAA